MPCRRRSISTTQLRQKLTFQVESLGKFILTVEVFQHIPIDDGLQVGLPESLDHLMETPEMLATQQTGWIEVLAGQLPQCRRWRGRQAQPDLDALGVLQRHGGSCPRIFFTFESRPIPFAEPQKEGLMCLQVRKVFGEVRARAVVLKQPRPAHGDAVGFPLGIFTR